MSKLSALWVINHTEESGVSEWSIKKADEIAEYLIRWNEKASTEDAEKLLFEVAELLGLLEEIGFSPLDEKFKELLSEFFSKKGVSRV